MSDRSSQIRILAVDDHPIVREAIYFSFSISALNRGSSLRMS